MKKKLNVRDKYIKKRDYSVEKNNNNNYNRPIKNVVRNQILQIINLKNAKNILTLESNKFILSKNLPHKKIYVYENNLKRFNKMKKVKPKNVSLFYGDVAEFSELEEQVDVIYLDYCCSFNLAMESISCLVDKIKQCDLFGVTISLRNYYSESEFGDYQFGLINKLQEITGINFKVLFGYSYRDTKQDGTKSGVMITIFLENQKGGNKE